MPESVDDRAPALDLGLSEKMSRAAQELVRNKFHLDLLASERNAKMLVGELHGGGYGPHEGPCFLAMVVPFYRAGDRVEKHVFAVVPTAHTLGCNWKWRHRHLDQDEVNRRVEELSSTEALLAEKLNPATYTWIKALGLFAPGEGKNRVDFFREEGIDNIPAKVFERDYPTPDRIELYRVRKEGFDETWAVLDRRWVQKVAYPTWAVPLLNAYGVALEQRWPSVYPAPEKVQLSFFERPGNTSPNGCPDLIGKDPTIDMDTLKARTEYQQEEMPCTAFDMKYTKINPLILKLGGMGVVVGIVSLGVSPDSWVEYKVAAGMLFGCSMMAMIMPFTVPFITTQRRNVERQLPLALERAPKYQARLGKRFLG
ncbi:hypothetical protein [Pseudomonas amygdali]|uniref:hypothetical protein n=1 Tax=Pseudomonas amygdali TaxID=47877 RepID=UPI001F27BDFE|nr:hypothetical protein [Pseudomonas amygdali]